MTDEVRFRPDLYAGTAGYYDRYRPRYPVGLMRRLVDEAGVTGGGRLLDLACGTGQVALALSSFFEEVWAVDQEADMVRVGRSTAARMGASNIRWLNRPVEALTAPMESFELVTVGNAFHRLPRQLMAAKAYGWLSPGSCFALLWGGSPWQENSPWQQVVAAARDTWVAESGASDRVPSGWEEARVTKPDVEVLQEAGFEIVGRFSEPATLEWSFESVVGYVYSTSILPRAVLGDRTAEFEGDLHQRLVEVAGDGPYIQETEFLCELGRRT